MAASQYIVPDYDRPPPLNEQISVERGTLVTDFDEYTFHAPCPGFFLGDSRTPSGEANPVTQFRLDRDEIPESPLSPPSLGSLDRLPFDILIHILPYLDLCSLIAFRSLNQRSREIVDSLRSFQAVAAFPKLLGAVLQLQCRFFDLEALARCIRDPICSYCNYFGDLLYLITAERWCYKCWREQRDTAAQIVPRSSSTDMDALQDFSDVPHTFLWPGYYGARGRAFLTIPRLVFDQRAFRARPGSPYWDLPTSSGELPHHLRYVAVIRAPYFDEFTQSFEEGFLCRACAHQGWEHRERNVLAQMHAVPFPLWGVPWRRYTRDGMREHIGQYGQIYRLEESDGGRRYAHEHPFPRYSPWRENAQELVRISHFLRGCRDKKFQHPQLQPFILDSDGPPNP